jgi:hypothetical protein
MTFTAEQLHLDANIARRGQYVRFDAFGRYVLEVTDRIIDGLGMTFRANGDGTFTRVFF